MQLTITLIIIIITTLVSIGGFNNQKIKDDLVFYPPAVSTQKQYYRFFTCGLVHADWPHLIFNMLALYFFGVGVEKEFVRLFDKPGQYLYLVMYVTALLISILPSYFRHRDNYHYSSLGASGAVSAVIFAGLMLAPETEVVIIFLPFFPIPGFIFAPLYLLISAYLDKRGKDNINHSAHIWGAIYGLAFIIIAGRLIDYNVVEYGLDRIKLYMQARGWIS
jgi:membrane associated rhomboid family serine protease